MPQSDLLTVRAELRANLKLALPLMTAQLAGVGMGTVDTIFAGRLGAKPLAAVAVGTNVQVIFLVFFMGLLMSCSPIVAQMVGAGRAQGEIGGFLRRALRFALIAGLAWMLVFNLLAPPLLALLKLEPDTSRQTLSFVRALSGSGVGFCLWFALRSCAEGLGQTRPILYASLAGLASNAVLDWLLLFGHFGLPRLGATGCGLATTASTLLMSGLLALQFRRREGLREVLAAPPAPGEGAGSILRLGVPIALILTAEAGLFALSALLMTQFGDATMAAYQVAINFASLAFMIPLGVAMATTVRVGHAAGAAAMAAVRYRGLAGMGLGLGNAASNAAIMVVFGAAIAGFYTSDAGIAGQAAHFLLLAAVFQFFDGLQVTANGALRGIKDTRVPMLITLTAYWLCGLPVAWWLAFRAGFGPDGLWWGFTAGLGVAALGLSARFLHSTRRTQAF